MKYILATLALLVSIESASALNQLQNYKDEPFTEVKLLDWQESTRMPKLTIEQRNSEWVSYIEGAKTSPLAGSGPDQNYVHFCEKGTETCSDGIFYQSKDGPMLLVEVSDLNNKLLVRLACHFPRKQMDVRICADIDRGGQTKSIQNSDGAWEIVKKQASN